MHLLLCKYTSTILLTKTTGARNGVALSYYKVRGLYFLAVVFVANIFSSKGELYWYNTDRAHGLFFVFLCHTHVVLTIVRHMR